MVKNQLQVVVLLMFVFLIPTVGAQQDFKGSVGVRFGYGIGIAGTYTMRNNQNIEFLLQEHKIDSRTISRAQVLRARLTFHHYV